MATSNNTTSRAPMRATEFLSKYAMTGLLVIAAFVIGMLFTEVRYLRGGDSKTTTTPTGDSTVPSVTVAMRDILGDIDVNVDEVYSCYQEGRTKARVDSQMAGGTAAGVTGTPGSFIVVANNQGELIPGAYPYDTMKQIIDQYLKDGKTADTTTLTNLPAVTEDDNIRGSATAKVTIVEYADFDCPFCNRFHPTLNQILEEYDGQVRWVVRHFPLVQLHPNAPAVAQISECVGQIAGEDKFWEFTDQYFETKGGGAEITI